MGGRRWTDKEISWLIKNYKRLPIEKCCSFLNRTKHSVKIKARQKKLFFDKSEIKKPRALKKHEKEYLIKHYSNKTNKEISTELNRSASFISKEAKKLNLKKENKLQNVLTKEFLKKEYIQNKKKTREIGKIVGCSHNVILYYMKKYDIPRRPSSGRGSEKWKGYEDLGGAQWKKIQYNAKIRNIDFDLTIENAWKLYEKQNGLCALSNLPIRFFQKGSCYGWTASLDRINNDKGYGMDNVWWLHKDVNRIKYTYDIDYFIGLCKIVTNPIKENNNKNIDNICESYFRNLKRNAKKRNIKFIVTKKELINLLNTQNGLCNITGQKIYLPNNRKEYIKSNYTASVDRIDSNKYYEIENLQWVHKNINMSKWNLDEKYYKYLCKLVYKHSFEEI